MTVPASLQAAAELERRARCAADNRRIGVLFQRGSGWEFRGQSLSADEAAALRRSWRGKLVVVERRPTIPSWA